MLRALANAEGWEDDDDSGLPSWPAGQCSITELVRRLKRPGTSLTVTRASLSRTLRRLWRAGLVELVGWGRTTMTEAHQVELARLAKLEADPVAAYGRYQDFVQSYDMQDGYGSVAAYMAEQRRRAHRPDLRVKTVQITAAGRAVVNNRAGALLTVHDDRPVVGDEAG